jgi:hypothetical protein
MNNTVNHEKTIIIFELLKIMKDLDSKYIKHKTDICSEISDTIHDKVNFCTALSIIRYDNNKPFKKLFLHYDPISGFASNLMEYQNRIYYFKYNYRDHALYKITQIILAIFIILIMFPWASCI